MDYDEDQVLDYYVWEHFSPLLTDIEKRVRRAVTVERSGHDLHNRAVRSFIGLGEEEVTEALRDGWEAFRRRARDRVLAEHGGEIEILRCPACSRIVRTPRARQCLWCGHDWHDGRGTQAGGPLRA